jgi:hypothetical protein
MFLCILQMVNAILNRRAAASAEARRARSDPPLFDGVRREGGRLRPAIAKELGAALAQRGEVAYWVVPDAAATARSREQRADPRERLRLRSAKILDAAYRFLCECLIRDHSVNGLKVMLLRNIRIPSQFAVHIDETSEVRRGRMMWRKDRLLGVRLYDHAPPGALRLSDRFALRERYYAIPE